MIKRKKKQNKTKKRKNPIENRILSDDKILLTLYIQFIISRLNDSLKNPKNIYDFSSENMLIKAADAAFDLSEYLNIDVPEPPNDNSDEEFIKFLQKIAMSQNWTKQLKRMDDTQIISRSQLLKI